MSQIFAFQLGLKIQKTNIRAQKIDGNILEIYKIVVFIFSILDKDVRERFFENGFLLADIKLDIVFKIFCQMMSNVNIDF